MVSATCMIVGRKKPQKDPLIHPSCFQMRQTDPLRFLLLQVPKWGRWIFPITSPVPASHILRCFCSQSKLSCLCICWPLSLFSMDCLLLECKLHESKDFACPKWHLTGGTKHRSLGIRLPGLKSKVCSLWVLLTLAHHLASPILSFLLCIYV